MGGVIEHKGQPRCLNSGAIVSVLDVLVSEKGGYRAICPRCDKTLWLNKRDKQLFAFPEHIGRGGS